MSAANAGHDRQLIARCEFRPPIVSTLNSAPKERAVNTYRIEAELVEEDTTKYVSLAGNDVDAARLVAGCMQTSSDV